MKGSSPPLFQLTDYQRYIHYGLISEFPPKRPELSLKRKFSIA